MDGLRVKKPIEKQMKPSLNLYYLLLILTARIRGFDAGGVVTEL